MGVIEFLSIGRRHKSPSAERMALSTLQLRSLHDDDPGMAVE
jgi:hypothetical protein